MKQRLLNLPAPAKLNLFLHITGRRADGYHLLQTVFQFINLCDELQLNLRSDSEIVCHGNTTVPAAQDLSARAARLLQNHCACTLGADIHIRKHIPMGGGLGGGSSDAASVLLGLNQLWQLGLNIDELAQLGLRLGADVPIFVHGQAAWAEGVGEKITPLEKLPEPCYVVIQPPCHVSTQEIFCAPELTRDCKFITIEDFLQGRCTNVCEAVVCRRYPRVARALDWLAQFAPARMSGTGACIFAPLPDMQQARAIVAQAPWQAWAVRGLNRSPILACL
jgi:4-diphosphocytidyl-2-C-methyl-D-erythritol kinase